MVSLLLIKTRRESSLSRAACENNLVGWWRNCTEKKKLSKTVKLERAKNIVVVVGRDSTDEAVETLRWAHNATTLYRGSESLSHTQPQCMDYDNLSTLFVPEFALCSRHMGSLCVQRVCERGILWEQFCLVCQFLCGCLLCFVNTPVQLNRSRGKPQGEKLSTRDVWMHGGRGTLALSTNKIHNTQTLRDWGKHTKPVCKHILGLMDV